MRAWSKFGLLVLVAVCSPCAVLPASSLGSTAQITSTTLYFSAGAGKVNDTTVGLVGPSIVITDPGDAITPGAGCANVTVTQVSCTAAGVQLIDIGAGDQDDRVEILPSVTGLGDRFESGVYIEGEFGSDTLIGGPNEFNVIRGHLGGGQNDGPGDDQLTGGNRKDELYGSDGNDTIVGGDGFDRLEGGGGVDMVSGQGGDDSILEGIVPNGADQLFGGAGSNEISYGSRRGNVTLSLNGIADDGELLEGDNVNGEFTQIESGDGSDVVSGTGAPTIYLTQDGNDLVMGGAAAELILSGEGNDTLRGGDGGDQFYGGSGNDFVEGGAGDDSIYDDSRGSEPSGADRYGGGSGLDRLRYLTGEPVTVDLDGTADDGPPGEGDNAGTDLEDLEGSPFDDVLTGNDSANQISGGAGNDRISGLGGADALESGPGDDTLNGGTGIDSLEGAGGSDLIRSRDAGADDVDCGSASDVLLADSFDEFTPTCDSSSTGAALKTSRARLKKGKAEVRVLCPAAEGITCRVSVSAAKGKKVLARGSGSVKPGSTSGVTVKLTRAGRKARGKLTLKAKVSFNDAAGTKVTTTLPKLVLKQ